MDLGDLIVLLFILSGILSSVFGGKKQQQKRPPSRPRPRPGTPQGGAPGRPVPSRSGSPPRPERAEPAPMPKQMEDILRELGLQVEPEAPPEPEVVVEPEPVVVRPEPPPVRRRREPAVRPTPKVVSLEDHIEEGTPLPAGVASHQAFHAKYIRPYRETHTAHRQARVATLLSPKNLRGAILLREILGPPRGTATDPLPGES